MLAGILLVRLLPVDQYALYTVASALLAMLTLGANMGVPQAVITLGSAADEGRLQRLVGAALPQCRRQFLITAPVVLGLAWFMLDHAEWALWSRLVCVGLVLLAAWWRIPTMIAAGILNARHQTAGLFQIGLVEAIARVALAPVCLIVPHAAVGVTANAIGNGWARVTSRRFLPLDAAAQGPADPELTAAIRAFVVPLVPIIIYQAVQGQISVLVLTAFGSVTSVAYAGAISRFNQIITVAMMLNPFLVQPILARQQFRASYVRRLGAVLGILSVGATLVLISAFVVPEWWLWILGSQYAGLRDELPLTLSIGVMTLLGGTLYTAVIARGDTSGQSWAIAVGIAGQLLFAATRDISTVANALLLSLIPAAAYVLVQFVILLRVLTRWSRPDTAST